MDYAYGPGERQDVAIQTFELFYDHRPNTTFLRTLSSIGLPSLEGLVAHLNDLDSSQKPIGDVYICSHGNESGWLEIRLASILPFGEVDFDALLQVPHRISKLSFNTNTITQPTGGQPGSTVRFRSCRIGHAEPFMQLLKNSFGGQVNVSGAKHFFNLGSGNINGQDLVYEYLSYNFLLTRRNTRFGEQRFRRLTTREQVILAFREEGIARHFTYFDGSTIPNNKWAQWVPRKAPRHKTTKPLELRLSVGFPRFNFDTEFRSERIDAPNAIPYSGQKPNHAQAVNLARTHLATLPEYQADYPPGRPAGVDPYPTYLRNGFSNLDDFVDAHHWKLGQVGGQSALIGSRMEYTLIVAIFDPATDLVIHNRVPISAGPIRASTGINETNSDLFWNQ